MNNLYLLHSIKSNSFIKYIESLPIHKELKSIITNRKAINSKMSAYLFYPLLFNNAFNYKSEKELDILCKSGYLYYRSISSIDSLVDGNNSYNKYTLLTTSICQEEAVKLLSVLFPIESEFWKIWSLRKKEFIKSIEKDTEEDNTLALEDYEVHADSKSAIGKIAIDAIYILSVKNNENNKIYANLLESHKLFSVGFQLSDDIEDFLEDLENKQKNYAIKQMSFYFKDNHINQNDFSNKEKYKFLYISGEATKILYLSLSYLDKALAIAHMHELHLWADTITHKRNHVLHLLRQSEAYSEIVINKRDLSNELICNINKNITLDASILKSMNFLIKRQKGNGCWNDFNFKGGISDLWVTAFIYRQLKEVDLLNSKTKSGDLVLTFLTENRTESGWACHITERLTDHIATIEAHLGLSESGVNLLEAIDYWQKNQNKDGGFSRYNRLSLKKNFKNTTYDIDGWSQSHTCLSSVIYYFMSKCKYNHDAQKRLKNYLFLNRQTSGLWNSYWWTSTVFSTSYITKALLNYNEAGDEELAYELVSAMVNDVCISKSDNAFYLSMILSTICYKQTIFNKFQKEADTISTMLINRQYNDGSWYVDNIFRQPLPSVINPNLTAQQYIQAPMRNFITAQVINGLKLYSKRKGEI
jgi:hypothetical protein